jgi:glycosyltransferase involved in cell wall biosynthesis
MDSRFEVVTLGSRDDTAALNRALLATGRDVLVIPEDATPLPGCLEELARARTLHDRVAAVIPVAFDGRLDDDEVRAGSGLPAAAEVPGPDGSFVLLAGEVRKMIGALDPAFTAPRDALTDWCLRAQRLGYVTLRALRAWTRVTATPAFARAPSLERRHPSWLLQREGAESDPAAQLPRQSLALRRGRITVCLDLRYLLEQAINGSGVYAVELARALVEHTPSDVFCLVTSEPQRQGLARLGLRVHREGEALPAFDVVHRPSQVFWAPDLRWLLRAPAPMVLTFQDLIAYRVPTAFPSPQEHAVYREVSHLSARAAQAVIAISEHNRGEIVSELLVPTDRVHVVHHGVHAQRFARRDAEGNRARLRALGLSDSFFFAVGADYAHKNLRLLLAAYASVRSRWAGPGPAPSLALAGHTSKTADGVYPRLREAAPPGVVFLDQVPDETLVALYQESLALMFPSAYEGFGLPILEAMAASTPVVGIRASAVPEVTSDAALLVDEPSDLALAEAMLALATRTELRSSLIARGVARAQAFTWEKTARETFRVYERAISAASPTSLQERRVAAGLAARLFA